ncbi:unnamed protein product [Cylicostephanus goldi]|uniref:Uncharacterized protein n=1 Tax=Cylicostephanus goldi TaxID=71465 RepID=A0A3P6T4Z8_CYLGO|nr:unnamed protein product [Cylicostephanus goldi]
MSPLFCFLALFLAVQNIDAERPTEVRVITNQLFHHLLNNMHMKVFRNMLDEYLGTKGINFAQEEIQERIVDERGMFAVRYILRGFECNESFFFSWSNLHVMAKAEQTSYQPSKSSARANPKL